MEAIEMEATLKTTGKGPVGGVPGKAAASTIIIRVMTLWFAVLIGWGVFLFTPGFRSLLSEAARGEREE